MTDDGLPFETAETAQTAQTSRTTQTAQRTPAGQDTQPGKPARTDGPIETIAARVRTEFSESIRRLIAFGPAVHGDGALRTEADLLAVIEDADVATGANEETDCERALTELAHDVALERGIVLTVHVLPVERFEANADHPFIEQAIAEGTEFTSPTPEDNER
ncbi:hypothetical protein [Natrialba asiatica]|uniref:Uncharacterized protein n=1 Tax=Natrialba asiatica (strain ATCC 700177 / DSM 12278 / JCM 9576 / FERM P-10747 / NBRC 102637 / 172P1) TaxID=29540 RepID=M0B0Y4_NATA1|nr:hypothetical protein [Natrialba asiatica]ELZ03898.1 hypothetical protein C481_04948 [Natrialba asiatica DSM 12278]